MPLYESIAKYPLVLNIVRVLCWGFIILCVFYYGFSTAGYAGGAAFLIAGTILYLLLIAREKRGLQIDNQNLVLQTLWGKKIIPLTEVKRIESYKSLFTTGEREDGHLYIPISIRIVLSSNKKIRLGGIAQEKRLQIKLLVDQYPQFFEPLLIDIVKSGLKFRREISWKEYILRSLMMVIIMLSFMTFFVFAPKYLIGEKDLSKSTGMGKMLYNFFILSDEQRMHH